MSSTPSTADRFGLSTKALSFSQHYAERPDWSIAECARRAGYADRSRAAHVRGAELLRDPRVAQAVLHFGRMAFARAQAAVTARLDALRLQEAWLTARDKAHIKSFALDLHFMRAAVDRLSQLEQ